MSPKLSFPLSGFLIFLICCSVVRFSEAVNSTITQGEIIIDGQTVVSPGQIFALGFLSLGNSSLRYVGIYYNQDPARTIIWIANRENPISGTTGRISIRNDGNLVILDSNSSEYWSSNASSLSTNSTAILRDTGDLVLLRSQDVNDVSMFLWKSFINPTDTYLPDMRAYTNPQNGPNQIFSSWRSETDPSPGNYTMGLDPRGSPQIMMWEGTNRRWRSGHWNGLVFTGVPSMRSLYLFGFQITVVGDGDVYFTYNMVNESQLTRFRVNWNGTVQQLIWSNESRVWTAALSQPSNACEEYNRCGNFGICSVTSLPICRCTEGFVPRNLGQWNNGNWSRGCMRRTPLECGVNSTRDGFLRVESVKLPDFADDIRSADNTGECEEVCLRNCSCNAYTFLDGVGCMIWTGDLIDVEVFENGGQSVNVRLANSELGRESRVISRLAIILIVVFGAILLGAGMWILWRYRRRLRAFAKSKKQTPEKNTQHMSLDMTKSEECSAGYAGEDGLSSVEGKPGSGQQLSLFSFSNIEIATESFALKNKLGQGGFGPVYKGTLSCGQIIAVKRLSKLSGQGLVEFKNEMILIAKLQHRNLVRLLGCCVEGEEKLLVYEYMPNKSLDSFLFDPKLKAELDWKKRFMIIEGIARGILYLHRDSRLRIIHRDLKASNILLDEEMNPKISDFGMARIFGGNQNEANTIRVVGTYGYMSPEYAMEGLFSVKSDVYSFGVLLLEIISGMRNNHYWSPECSNLIRYAWNLWNDGKSAELIDPSIAESCSTKEALQCIHVAMLCIQVSAAHRPSMSSVMLFLESENASLPAPIRPDVNSLSSVEMDLFMQNHDVISSNEITITDVDGR
jgi:serine/threonine protein kinase